LVDGLRGHDTYLLMADFADYVATQSRVDALFCRPDAWAATVWRNIAAMGQFSVDRTVRQYVQQVWAVPNAVPND
jgi:starch phosphorylase